MGERLYSINEFLLAGFEDEPSEESEEDQNPTLLTQHSTSTIAPLRSDTESNHTTCPNFYNSTYSINSNAFSIQSNNTHSRHSSSHSIPRLSFQSAQSGADSDSMYTEDDSSIDGSCTFLEFLKECDGPAQFQNKKDDFNDFLYQPVRRSSRQSILTTGFNQELTGFNQELTLLEFLTEPEIMYQDIMFSETASNSRCSDANCSDTTSEQFDMISLHEFLSESSSLENATSSPDQVMSSSRTSSVNSETVTEKKRIQTPSTRSSSDASLASDRSITGIKKGSRESGIKCSRDNHFRSSKRGLKDSKNKPSKLETIVSPSTEEDSGDMFSFYELLARPELIDDMKPPVTNTFTSSGILDNIIRPLMSPKPKPLKPRKRLSSSCKSLDSNGRGEMRMKTDKSSSICSSESLNHATSETSLESSSVDDHPTAPNHCSLLEFLLEPPPPSYLAPSSDLTRTSSFLSLQSVAKDYKDYNDFNDYNDLFSNQPFSQNFGKKPIYGTKQLYRSRAKSDEDLMQECSLAEFLSTPHLNLAPKKQSIGSGIFGGFSLAKSLRQLSLGSVSLEKSFTVSEILALRRGSILDDLLGGEMNSPDKAGLLKKQGNSRLRDWKSRYCAVKDGTFCYYESYEAYCIATPINSIYCGTLKAQISDRARFKFEVIVPNRTYYFMAQTESEMMSWIESLNKAVAAALTDLKSSGSTAKELIQRIYEEPSNAFCADCNSPDPKWASINLGVVVCIKCSGSHRDLGVHISKVRSLELDVKAWTDDMVSVFHRIGNRRANEYFEKTLDPTVYDRPAPDSDMKVREAFIEEKYTRGCWSDVITSPVEELNLELMEVVQTDQLDRTLALLMSGADVKFIDETLDHSRRTPYLMALASGQKAQAQLLLLNDADPVLPQENNEPADSDVPVDLEGILEKKGPNAIQSYKKRKCVLSGKVLKYYDDHDSFKNEIDMHKLVEVELAEAEQPDDDRNSDDYFYLRIRTDTRTFLFREKDRSYVSLWYDALKATQIFGVPIDKQPKTQNGIPVLVHKCVIFLENKIDTEGLYRISGVKTRIEKLRLLFNQNLHEVTLSDEHHVTHDVTSMMKQYFRELPVSLLGPWNQQLTEAVEIDDETERLYQIQDLIYELPATEFHTLKFVLQHLYSVAQQQSVNKMGSENLGVIFGPTLMSTHEVGSEFNPHEYQLVTTLIDYFPWIFQVNVELEESKGKELKLAEAELRKIMSNIDAPQGSVENSWIVEVFHNQNSVNIKIESGQTLRDVSAEILYRAKLADGDYALHEFLCNGQLQRPVHLSEYLLNTTVTLWEERVQRSWLAIDYNNIKEKLKIYEPPPHDSTEQGSLHMYEAKKKWREVQCKLSQDNFTYSKLKVKTNLNLLNYTWYLGCETNLSPPTHHCFTLRCVSPTRDHKDDIFKVFCAADEAEMWRWLYRINYVKFKEPDYRLVRSKRATLQNPNNRNSFILLDSRLPT
ncbi:arf-GAP with Rho-GAP domain, ANK repeat and PH domain-containing protein 1-like isoform X2 [Bolinopsis microptera]|uniref:arf-GAP with Rho-GAP domain, ANK repeat and PH domain-containing protein 1-like isoform X2 n=1 Tax=Bolinopsis microptera TaxID=2820187 RepID=UPI003079892E